MIRQLYVSAALFPGERTPVPTELKAGWANKVWAGRFGE